MNKNYLNWHTLKNDTFQFVQNVTSANVSQIYRGNHLGSLGLYPCPGHLLNGRYKLDFLEEKRDESHSKLTAYYRKITFSYDAKKLFHNGDLILREVFLFSKEPDAGMLGPYHNKEKLRPGSYKIENCCGKAQPRPQNVEHLEK